MDDDVQLRRRGAIPQFGAWDCQFPFKGVALGARPNIGADEWADGVPDAAHSPAADATVAGDRPGADVLFTGSPVGCSG